ncbi:MAG: hypothetical protein PF486_14090 [Prolixibacteraceae bacterium]|jgi:hypothetical protein|nr:hypothetical protein [Prolixibacteraceae bacterium]
MTQLNTRAEFKKKNGNLPIFSVTGSLLVIGCNYHTTWQKHRNMRFVLTELKGDKARLQTRKTGCDFWTDTKDLIWIDTNHNNNKAKEYLNED